MKLTKFFVSLAAIAIVTEVTRRIVTDNNAQSVWNWEDDDMFFYTSDDDDFMEYYGFKRSKAAETAEQKAERERKKARKLVLLEQDYELASLSDAISTQNETEIARSKARLAEIHSELEALG